MTELTGEGQTSITGEASGSSDASVVDYRELSASDLAALLCSKVCHDIISPVGAITNGLELLDENIDDEMRGIAFDLIRKSATQASSKLKFARLAYGAAGSAGAEIDTGDAEQVAHGYVAAEKQDIEWSVPRSLLPKDQVKLLLNLVLFSLNCVPRGGLIKVSANASGEKTFYKLVCSGKNARVPEALAPLLKGISADSHLDAHAVQPYYAGMLARLSGLSINVEMNGEDVVIVAS